MMRNRIIWIALWLLSLVVISFYGGTISYGFFYTMTLIPVFSLLYLLYIYIFFRIYQYTDGRDFVVNDAIPYSFKLINEYHLPFAGIRVKFFSPFSTINDLSDKTEYELMPGSGIIRETTLICHYRGEYEIGIKEVIVTDYFRLFSITYRNNECKRVIVKPQLVRLKSLGSFQMNTNESLVKADKLDVVSREYVQGDDVRFINWSQSARTGNLMTREKIGEEGSGVAIIMDACRYSQGPHIYLPVENKILELTIAIAMFFCEKGILVTEHHMNPRDGVGGSFSDTNKMAGVIQNHVYNNQQFETFYNNMSSVSFDVDNTQELLFSALMRNDEIMCNSVVYMVLPNWSAAADAMSRKLAEQNKNTIIYLISDDINQKIDVSRPDLIDIITISPEAKLEEVIQ